MILAMCSISILGSVVWGHHMYTIGMESDTRAYFTTVTIMISLPTGTKIFNWLCTYLGNAPLLQIRTSAVLFALIFLLMFTIGGSTGVIVGNAAVDIALHDTYYVVAHFHFVLSLGAVIAIFSGIMFFQEKISGTNNIIYVRANINGTVFLLSPPTIISCHGVPNDGGLAGDNRLLNLKSSYLRILLSPPCRLIICSLRS